MHSDGNADRLADTPAVGHADTGTVGRAVEHAIVPPDQRPNGNICTKSFADLAADCGTLASADEPADARTIARANQRTDGDASSEWTSVFNADVGAIASAVEHADSDACTDCLADIDTIVTAVYAPDERADGITGAKCLAITSTDTSSDTICKSRVDSSIG